MSFRQIELDLADRVPVVLVRNFKARRYILRVLADGTARVTLPRWGSQRDARAFAESHMDWIRRQRQRLMPDRPPDRAWREGAEILFRGEFRRITRENGGDQSWICLGDVRLPVKGGHADYRELLELHFRALARHELAQRTGELAQEHQLTVRRVSVRNQRSRWGSCSPKGTISLNWRLILAPPWVRDYLILHELMHLREMNHSARFWRRVAEVCPRFEEAEAWLKRQAKLLR